MQLQWLGNQRLDHLARTMEGGLPPALYAVHLGSKAQQLLSAELEVCISPALANSIGWRVLQTTTCMSMHSQAIAANTASYKINIGPEGAAVCQGWHPAGTGLPASPAA